jgi:hypothetical protein
MTKKNTTTAFKSNPIVFLQFLINFNERVKASQNSIKYMSTKKIEFTAEQYIMMMKLVYLGRWMAGSHAEEPEEWLETIEQYLYSYCKNFGLTEICEFDTENNRYMPTVELEEEMENAISEYDDFTFWDELAWRLAERDFGRKFDEAQIICMTGDEIYREKNLIADKYFEDFKKNGIEKITLAK